MLRGYVASPNWDKSNAVFLPLAVVSTTLSERRYLQQGDTGEKNINVPLFVSVGLMGMIVLLYCVCCCRQKCAKHSSDEPPTTVTVRAGQVAPTRKPPSTATLATKKASNKETEQKSNKSVRRTKQQGHSTATESTKSTTEDKTFASRNTQSEHAYR